MKAFRLLRLFVALALTTALTHSSIESAESGKDLCSLFTVQEIQGLLGAPVGTGEVAGPLGTACQWSGSSDADAIYAQIQIIEDTNYWSKPTLATGYKALSGIGKEAFVVPEMGGWSAQALTDTAVNAVAVNGGTANSDTAITLLRLLLERRK